MVEECEDQLWTFVVQTQPRGWVPSGSHRGWGGTELPVFSDQPRTEGDCGRPGRKSEDAHRHGVALTLLTSGAHSGRVPGRREGPSVLSFVAQRASRTAVSSPALAGACGVLVCSLGECSSRLRVPALVGGKVAEINHPP